VDPAVIIGVAPRILMVPPVMIVGPRVRIRHAEVEIEARRDVPGMMTMMMAPAPVIVARIVPVGDADS